MKCNSCRSEIYNRKIFKCIICERIFCLECHPFERSPICIDHYKMIPWRNKEEFANFCIKKLEQSKFSESMWVTSSLFFFLILPIFIGMIIGREIFLAIIFTFSIFIIITYASCLFIFLFAGDFLILKKRDAKILKLWKEIMGNPIIL